ncbi:MAG: hypothetical protein ACPGED_07435 [Flavobacteriales bacterium]
MAEKFPIYLEIANGLSIYKLLSESEMVETQKIGSKYVCHHLLAKIYPEKVLIADMISNDGKRWVRLTEDEYENKLMHIKSNFKQMF